MDPFSLDNKDAIITGASRGIGEAIAHTNAQAGAKVVLASRKLESVASVAETIKQNGGDALPIAAHMGEPEAITNLVQQTIATYGGVDIVVNDAATNPHFGSLLDSPESAWDKMLDVNLRGYFRLIREAVPSMEARGSGKVLNIASVAGLTPQTGMGLYCITKAAVIMLTKVLAVELGSSNIQVNAIAPGFIKTKFSQVIWQNDSVRTTVTDRTPAHRIGDPEDLLGMALYLVSHASNFTTGQAVIIDGGLTL